MIAVSSGRTLNFQNSGRKAKLLNRLAGLLERLTPERNFALLEHLVMNQRNDRSLTEVLRYEITNSERSRYALAKESGVSESQISRFMSGERSLSLDAADKLAAVLGLSLSRTPQPGEAESAASPGKQESKPEQKSAIEPPAVSAVITGKPGGKIR